MTLQQLFKEQSERFDKTFEAGTLVSTARIAIKFFLSTCQQEWVESLGEEIERMNCNENKVSVFGKGQDSWEARTYDEKSLVNAVLKKVLSIINTNK